MKKAKVNKEMLALKDGRLLKVGDELMVEHLGFEYWMIEEPAQYNGLIIMQEDMDFNE